MAESIYKDILKEHKDYIIHQVTAIQLREKLLKAKVIDKKGATVITEKHEKSKKAGMAELHRIISSGGIKAFNKFLEALRKESYNEVADVLEKSLAKKKSGNESSSSKHTVEKSGTNSSERLNPKKISKTESTSSDTNNTTKKLETSSSGNTSEKSGPGKKPGTFTLENKTETSSFRNKTAKSGPGIESIKIEATSPAKKIGALSSENKSESGPGKKPETTSSENKSETTNSENKTEKSSSGNKNESGLERKPKTSHPGKASHPAKKPEKSSFGNKTSTNGPIKKPETILPGQKAEENILEMQHKPSDSTKKKSEPAHKSQTTVTQTTKKEENIVNHKKP